MKLASYCRDGLVELGLVAQDEVFNLRLLAGHLLKEGCLTAQVASDDLASLDCMLAAGHPALSLALACNEFLVGGQLPQAARDASYLGALSEVSLLAASPRARKLFCLAGNYEEHIRESRRAKEWIDLRQQKTPRVFMKPPTTTLVGSGAPIVLPRVGHQIDWEVELAVVMGRQGKYIPREQALQFVLGYCLLNDVSERAFQVRERGETSEWDRFFDWLNGKWFDGFAPLGPYIVTRDELADPHSVPLRLQVNGETMQSASTADMIFDVQDIIAFISTFVTLQPGDVIATGTPSGVGMARGIFLKPGDLVIASADGLGQLVNPVEAEAA